MVQSKLFCFSLGFLKHPFFVRCAKKTEDLHDDVLADLIIHIQEGSSWAWGVQSGPILVTNGVMTKKWLYRWKTGVGWS